MTKSDAVFAAADCFRPEMVAWLKKHCDMSMALNDIVAMLALSAAVVLLGRTGASRKT